MFTHCVWILIPLFSFKFRTVFHIQNFGKVQSNCYIDLAQKSNKNILFLMDNELVNWQCFYEECNFMIFLTENFTLQTTSLCCLMRLNILSTYLGLYLLWHRFSEKTDTIISIIMIGNDTSLGYISSYRFLHRLESCYNLSICYAVSQQTFWAPMIC